MDDQNKTRASVSRGSKVASQVAKAARAVNKTVAQEAPQTHKYLSFKAREANQQFVQPGVDAAKTSVAKAVHAVVDASESRAKKALAREAGAKLKVDFTSAAHKPVMISRSKTTAEKDADGRSVRVNLNVPIRSRGR